MPPPAKAKVTFLAYDKKQKKKKNKVGIQAKAVIAPASRSTMLRNEGPKLGTNKSFTVKHREFLQDIKESKDYMTVEYYNQPGLTDSYPWLGNIGALFEFYEFRVLKYHFVPSCSTATAGTVGMVTLPNSQDPVPTSKEIFLTFEGAQSGPAWKAQVMGLRKDNRFKKRLLIRTVDPLPADDDAALYDTGAFVICTQGFASTTAIIGSLFVEYSVTFYNPKRLNGATGGYYMTYANVPTADPNTNLATSTYPIGISQSTEPDGVYSTVPGLELSGWFPPGWIMFKTLTDTGIQYISDLIFSEPGVYELTQTINETSSTGSAWYSPGSGQVDITILAAKYVVDTAGWATSVTTILYVAKAAAIFYQYWAGGARVRNANLANMIRTIATIPLSSISTLPGPDMPYQTCSAEHRKHMLKITHNNPYVNQRLCVTTDSKWKTIDAPISSDRKYEDLVSSIQDLKKEHKMLLDGLDIKTGSVEETQRLSDYVSISQVDLPPKPVLTRHVTPVLVSGATTARTKSPLR